MASRNIQAKVSPVGFSRLLRPTDVPGVYRNKAGQLVNEDGVKMSMKDIKTADNDALIEARAAGDHSPIELLRAWANDPRLPLAVRIDCAAKVANFYAPKLQTVTAQVTVTPSKLDYSKMSKEELQRAMDAANTLDALQKGGAT